MLENLSAIVVGQDGRRTNEEEWAQSHDNVTKPKQYIRETRLL